jgi:hypothetical protein
MLMVNVLGSYDLRRSERAQIKEKEKEKEKGKEKEKEEKRKANTPNISLVIVQVMNGQHDLIETRGYHIVTRVFSPEEQPVPSTQELCWSIKGSITKAETKNKNRKKKSLAHCQGYKYSRVLASISSRSNSRQKERFDRTPTPRGLMV